MALYTIIGGSGFIGNNLGNYLITAGHTVSSPARDDSTVMTRQLGHVIFAAGTTADFRERPYDTVRAHVSLLSEFLEYANFESLLYLSSTRVYGDLEESKEISQLHFTPDSPSDFYNISKIMGEALCFRHENQKVRIARLSNVVGFNLHSMDFLYSMIRDALNGGITLRSDLASEKDYIHIDDVLYLLTKISESGTHRIYNVASGIHISNRDWVNRIQQITACSLTTTRGSNTLTYPPIDIQRIEREFNFQPRPVLGLLPELINRIYEHTQSTVDGD